MQERWMTIAQGQDHCKEIPRNWKAQTLKKAITVNVTCTLKLVTQLNYLLYGCIIRNAQPHC